MYNKKTLWLLVRKQTIPTERPPAVDEVCKLLRVEDVEWSMQWVPTSVNLSFLYLLYMYMEAKNISRVVDKNGKQFLSNIIFPHVLQCSKETNGN
jgi:hypothetical protein